MDERKRARHPVPGTAFSRTRNTLIEGLGRVLDPHTSLASWVCECVRRHCLERLELTIAEYEQVRRHPLRFVVAPDEEHVDASAEHVVLTTDRYWVVEKRGDEARGG
jgi:hypothetical protein